LQSPSMRHGCPILGKPDDALAILAASIPSEQIFRSLQVKPFRSLLVFYRTGPLKG
jgi:hypothetical protein